MCGIFSYLFRHHAQSLETLTQHLNKIDHRGPDSTHWKVIDDLFLGFHRLAINGLDEMSDQPMKDRDGTVYLICNGEIFNYQDLIHEYSLQEEYQTHSDCEVIIHLYKKIGFDAMCKKLDGEFAFLLYDVIQKKIYVARDQLGVRSLYWKRTYSHELIEFAISSEMKAFVGLVSDCEQFPPASYWSSDTNEIISYFTYENSFTDDSEEMIIHNLKQLFEKATDKRLLSERRLACLLSGGLDSSTVAALVAKKMGDYQVNTYSIGMKGSTDLYYAQLMANYIKTNHVNIELTEEEFLNAIEKTIYQIESYDTTSVRASVGNYLVSLYIKKNSDDTVIFCGDVSDEIFASYRGFSGEHNDSDFYQENIKMLNNIHYFDILRSDKTISGAGLEARVPFADKEFIEYVMKIPPSYKKFSKEKMEKYYFRKAFEDILPEEILWRRKEAFSDGVSSHERSWFTIIKEFVDKKISDEEYEQKRLKYTWNMPYDKESLYYREIFEKYYPNYDHTIPYFWRHPFSTQLDPSARLLAHY